jgi:hypothetical protein
MKLICPSCAAIHSAESWLNDADARACMQIIAKLPKDVSAWCLNYLALFRSSSGRGLQWKTALRLITELLDMVAAGHIRWDGKPARYCTPRIWGQALEKLTQHPPQRLPLKSHGYLQAMVYDMADDVDREAEKKHNQAERSGQLRPKTGEKQPERMTLEEMKKISDEKYWKKKR